MRCVTRISVKQHTVLEIIAAVVVVVCLIFSFSAKALTLSASPGTPTSPLTTYINGADRASFPVTVPLATSTTGVAAGDRLELFVNGASFPSPVRRTLTEEDVAAGQYTFTLSLTFANNLSNGVKNFTAALSSNGVAYSSSSPALTLTLDATAPTLSYASLSSSNAASQRAVTGDTVTLSFTANESISTPSVTIAGRSVTPSGSGTSWSASTAVTSSDGEGAVPFSIAFSDLAGNSGTTVTSVRGGGTNVIIDRTAPYISAVSIITSASTTDGTSVNFAPTATDSVDGSRSVSCNYTSGALFVVGTTTVSCTSTDSAGNTGTGSFTVAVRTFTALTAGTTFTSGTQQAVADDVISGAYTLSIPSNVTSPTLNLNPLVISSGGNSSVSLGGSLTVTQAQGSDIFSLRIPSNLTITGPSSWSGIFKLPTFKASDSVTVTPTSGSRANTGWVIEVGSQDTALTLDRAIRLLIPRVWQEFLGKTSAGSFGTISTVCNADDQDSVDAQLSSASDCRLTVGQDIAVWTKRPGSFIVYSETPLTSSPSLVSAGGGGGGGGGGGATTAVQQTTPAVTQAALEPALVRPADIHSDGVVDILDFNSLMVGWGSSAQSSNADTNGDGVVDLLDFNTLMVYWGGTYQL